MEEERIAALKETNEQLQQEITERVQAESQREAALEALARQEAEIRATLYSIGDAVIATDTEGRVARVNPVAEQLTGWTEAEAVGQPLDEIFCIINEETRRQVESPVARVLCEGTVIGLSNHTLLISKEGREIPIADSGAPILDSQGNITGVVLVFRDQTEERLTRRFFETRLSLIEYAASHTLGELLTWALDEVGAFVDSPIGFYHFVKPDQKTLSLQQWSTRTLEEFCQAEGKGMHYSIDQAGVWVDCVHEKKAVIHNDYASLPHKKGMPEGHAQVTRELVVPVMREDKVVAILGVGNKPTEYTQKDVEIVSHLADVTWEIVRQKRAEEALRRERDRAQKYLDVAGVMFVALDARGEVTLINQRGSQVLGYERGEIVGKNWFDRFVPVSKRDQTRTVFDRLMAGEIDPVEYYENPVLTKGGEERIIAWHNTILEDDEGNAVGTLSSGEDITERVRAEEALRQLNQAMEQSPVSVLITDTDGIIQYVNPKFTQVTGYSAEEAIGQNPRLLQSGEHPPEFYRDMWDTLIAGQEWQGEFHNKKKNGELYWELASIAGVKDPNGKITHYVAVKEDITRRKQMEEETLRQERLAAVGQLAAGVAHDFNNLLTTIMGFSELLLHRYDLPDEAEMDLDRIVKQGQRAAQLVRQILDFTRQTINDPQPLDLKFYLNETLKFIERTIPERIQIRFNFERGDHSINADPTQLQQVITNLAVNARDAMPGGGTLLFELSRLSLAPHEAPPCPEMEAGDWVRLAVTDTGAGIPPEVLPHIFEPFFTTKEVGEGTGLGLAQIYGIVRQHAGCITVKSQVGQGTTFALYFPALSTHAAAEGEAVKAIPMGQGETILLVEDEQTVRGVVQAMLETLNYRVLTAEDGNEALAMYRAHADRIGLVLTDAVMPKMDGFALASALQAEAPGVKVLLMSGYARDSVTAPEMRQNICARLQKPLSLHQLAEALREALD